VKLSQSLYSKYREKFPALVLSLENARKYNRMAHAFMVHADTETARREFSVVTAQIAVCPESRDGKPCTVCKICTGLEKGDYPDLYTLSPIGKMYQIQVGDRTNPEPNTLRYFEERFFLTSNSEFAKKIGIIYDADRMNDEAQNALLKTLEEPPRDTLLILASGNPAALLPTTLSRCQELLLLENRCEFNFTGAEEVYAAMHLLFFEAQGDLAKAEAGAAALIRVSAGLSAAAAEQTSGEWAERMEAASRIDPSFAKKVEAQQTAAANGAYMRQRGQFLTAIRTYCAQLFILASGGAFEDLANPEMFPQGEPGVIDPERAAAANSEAEELLFTLLFNVNEELALRTFAVNIAMK
jgi:DNA polymerase-3 subunit delta'